MTSTCPQIRVTILLYEIDKLLYKHPAMCYSFLTEQAGFVEIMNLAIILGQL